MTKENNNFFNTKIFSNPYSLMLSENDYNNNTSEILSNEKHITNCINSFLKELSDDYNIFKEINFQNNDDEDFSYLVQNYSINKVKKTKDEEIKKINPLNNNSSFFLSNNKKRDQKEEEEENGENSFLGKKRGKKSEKSLKERKKCHSKFDKDNIIRKIQVNYITFLVKYVNYNIRKNLGKNHPVFKDLNYRFKSDIKKSFFSEIKTKTIGEVLKNESTIKNDTKIKKKIPNQQIYDLLNKSKNQNIIDLLQMNYFYVFKYIYAYSLYNKDDCETIIKRYKIPRGALLFEDLLEIEKKNNPEYGDEYIKKIKNVCLQYFLSVPQKIFKLKKIE